MSLHWRVSSDRRVWQIVVRELVPLKVAVLAMIGEVERETKD